MENRELTVLQLIVILVSTNIGVGMLAFPRFVALKAETASISATVFGSMIALIGIMSIAYLGKVYDNKTFVGYSREILGEKLGAFFIIIIILFFIIITGLELRQFGEVIIGSLLPKTPIYVPMMMIAFICMLASLHSVNVFAYIHLFYIAFTVAPIIFILLVATTEIDWIYIQPLLGNETTWDGFMTGGFVVTKVLLNFFVISMVIPFMRQPNKAVLASFVGWIIVTILYTLAMFFTLAVFGSTELENLMWPILVLGRLVRIPAEVFQRLDALLLVAWMFAVFTTLYSTFYFSVRASTELFLGFRQRIVAALLFGIILAISLLPKDVYEMYEVIKVVSSIGLFLIIGYPLFLLFIRKVKGSDPINESS
ncbi:GerAB/ArcD/ProY family transporter [Halalkalibacter sp. AB-rgal2]|uniref:GerAB/ArcD/ProY family transporter n=1 Tax=Halalkalibacter sp. AB-rgal2 TaxID=3242695 RepID=UPI00359D84D2